MFWPRLERIASTASNLSARSSTKRKFAVGRLEGHTSEIYSLSLHEALPICFFAGRSFDDVLAETGKNRFDGEQFVGPVVHQEKIRLGDGSGSWRFGGSVLARS